jgi:hypothetical protein
MLRATGGDQGVYSGRRSEKKTQAIERLGKMQVADFTALFKN